MVVSGVVMREKAVKLYILCVESGGEEKGQLPCQESGLKIFRSRWVCTT
jgi:hypothetical protein